MGLKKNAPGCVTHNCCTPTCTCTICANVTNPCTTAAQPGGTFTVTKSGVTIGSCTPDSTGKCCVDITSTGAGTYGWTYALSGCTTQSGSEIASCNCICINSTKFCACVNVTGYVLNFYHGSVSGSPEFTITSPTLPYCYNPAHPGDGYTVQITKSGWYTNQFSTAGGSYDVQMAPLTVTGTDDNGTWTMYANLTNPLGVTTGTFYYGACAAVTGPVGPPCGGGAQLCTAATTATTYYSLVFRCGAYCSTSSPPPFGAETVSHQAQCFDSMSNPAGAFYNPASCLGGSVGTPGASTSDNLCGSDNVVLCSDASSYTCGASTLSASFVFPFSATTGIPCCQSPSPYLVVATNLTVTF
jgi:hypothetical protein